MAAAILSRAPEARRSLEVPAVISADVPALKFSEALTRAGLIGRHDAARGVFVIEPAPARCRACGGSGLDEDARCGFCGGTGRDTAGPQAADALGMAWYNSLTRSERLRWHTAAGSAVPADAWRAFCGPVMTDAPSSIIHTRAAHHTDHVVKGAKS